MAAMSISTSAQAAVVDIFYSFDSVYYANCERPCENFKKGDFEVRLKYKNVSYDPERPYGFSYGGETTAKVVTPIGDIQFQAIGRGAQRFYSEEPFDFLEFNGSESFSSVLEPKKNFFNFGVVELFTGNEVISDGLRGVFDLATTRQRTNGDGTANFRFENDRGAFLTSEPPTVFLKNVQISVSEVPLPASAPLLIAGLVLLRLRKKSKAVL